MQQKTFQHTSTVCFSYIIPIFTMNIIINELLALIILQYIKTFHISFCCHLDDFSKMLLNQEYSSLIYFHKPCKRTEMCAISRSLQRQSLHEDDPHSNWIYYFSFSNLKCPLRSDVISLRTVNQIKLHVFILRNVIDQSRNYSQLFSYLFFMCFEIELSVV